MRKILRQEHEKPRIVPAGDEEEQLAKQRLDQELDQQLEDTFPASDALKITLRRPERPSKLRRLKTKT
jgi:hypothetical protein